MFSALFLKHEMYEVQFCYGSYFDLRNKVVLIRYHKYPVTCRCFISHRSFKRLQLRHISTLQLLLWSLLLFCSGIKTPICDSKLHTLTSQPTTSFTTQRFFTTAHRNALQTAQEKKRSTLQAGNAALTGYDSLLKSTRRKKSQHLLLSIFCKWLLIQDSVQVMLPRPLQDWIKNWDEAWKKKHQQDDERQSHVSKCEILFYSKMQDGSVF